MCCPILKYVGKSSKLPINQVLNRGKVARIAEVFIFPVMLQQRMLGRVLRRGLTG